MYYKVSSLLEPASKEQAQLGRDLSAINIEHGVDAFVILIDAGKLSIVGYRNAVKSASSKCKQNPTILKANEKLCVQAEELANDRFWMF